MNRRDAITTMTAAAATLALGEKALGDKAMAQTTKTVAVIGSGRMGGAVGPRFAELGYNIVYGTRDPNSEAIQKVLAKIGPKARAASQLEAIAAADIVALALLWRATPDLVREAGARLDGKIIFDITNAPLKYPAKPFDGAVDTSAGKIIQDLAPKARVVKAFNTVGYHVVADPAKGKGPVTVPVVGNDMDAKTEVMDIVKRMGFETIELGPIENAHVLEGMANLYFYPYGNQRFEQAFEYHLRQGTAPTDMSQYRGPRVRQAE
jgi:predicted dinucleotide-binding enzyme